MEYRISTGNRIFRSIFGLLALAAAIYLFAVPLNAYKGKTDFQFGFGTVLLLLGLYLVLDAFLKLLIINENSVTLKGLLLNRTLTYNEIKGFRVTTGKTTFLIIVPIAEHAKSIRISSDFQKFTEIQNQLKTKLADLDEQTYQQENLQILSNADFGATNEEREANRKKAALISRILIITSGILIFGVIVFNFYETFLAPVAVLISIITFYCIARFKGLIQIFDTNAKSAYSLIWPAILLPVGAFWGIALISLGTIFDYTNFWKPAIIIFFISAVIVYKACERTLAIANSKIASIIVLVTFLGAFSYSATIFADKYFDTSAAKKYDVILEDKSVSTSSKGHKSYWLYLPAWGQVQDSKQYKVSKELYYKVYPGDTVHVILNQGKLNIPWYNITQ